MCEMVEVESVMDVCVGRRCVMCIVCVRVCVFSQVDGGMC